MTDETSKTVKITDLDHNSLELVSSNLKYKIDRENFFKSFNDRNSLESLWKEHQIVEIANEEKIKEFIKVNIDDPDKSDSCIQSYLEQHNISLDFSFPDHAVLYKNEEIFNDHYNININRKHYFYHPSCLKNFDLVLLIVYNNKIDFINIEIDKKNIIRLTTFNSITFDNYISTLNLDHGAIILEDESEYILKFDIENSEISKCILDYSLENNKIYIGADKYDKGLSVLILDNKVYNLEKDLYGSHFEALSSIYEPTNQNKKTFIKLANFLISRQRSTEGGDSLIMMNSRSIMKYNKLLFKYLNFSINN